MKNDMIIVENDCESAKDTFEKIKNIVVFENGSMIECLYPKKEEETIRGKRAYLNPWVFDYEMVLDKEILNEVLKEYLYSKEKP